MGVDEQDPVALPLDEQDPDRSSQLGLDHPPSRHTFDPTSGIHYKKRHIHDILGRTKIFCHTYDTSMTIIVTKPGIIIDVVGSYFYDKKS